MKAFLLAAGLGTRLRPITNEIPKCMVPVQGKPMLGWWMDLFEKHGVTEALINTHYLPDSVRQFIKNYNDSDKSAKIIESYEPKLLGSGGTIRDNCNFVKNEEDFLVCYADNLTNANLSELMKFHKNKKCVLTMGLFETNNPKGCGIASQDVDGLITEFIEKPEHPKSDLANAGIYAVNKAIWDYIPTGDNGEIDFGKDVLPLLVGKMYGYKIQEYLLDIGTMDNYKKAQVEWESI